MELLLIFIVSVIIGGMIGSAKGQTAAGILLSLLLGPLGGTYRPLPPKPCEAEGGAGP